MELMLRAQTWEAMESLSWLWEDSVDERRVRCMQEASEWADWE